MIYDCTVTIADDTTAAYEDNQGRAVKKQKLSATILDRETIEWFDRWVRDHGDTCTGRELKLLGSLLYRFVFSGEIGTQFETTYGVFDQARKDQPEDDKILLRLRLVLGKKADQLVRYPWEFLHMPWREKGHFLAGEATQLILTRFVPSKSTPSAGPARPLRILLAFCHPPDLRKVNVEDILAVMDQLEAIAREGDIEVIPLDNPTYADLQKAIEDDVKKPHILHLIAHGEPHQIAMRRPDTEILRDERENEKRKAQGSVPVAVDMHMWIEGETVARLFRKHKPHLVFLQACSSAAESLEGIYSTARDLVYEDIAAVVAMQYEITNDAAVKFATTFYQALAAGSEIDAAVTVARERLAEQVVGGQTWNDRTFGAPVVYLQSERPIVEAPPATDGQKGGGMPEFAQKVPCPYPDGCLGMVTTRNRICLKCQRSLQLCVRGHVMAAEIGICGECPYSPEEATVGAAGPSAAAGAPPSRASGMDPGS